MKYTKLLPLFVIQFFTWLGLFALWIYATPVIGKLFFAEKGQINFEKSASWTGFCFALYSLLGASLTFILHKILKRNSKYLIHALCLLTGGLGLISMTFIQSKYAVFFSFVLIGIAWSSIMTVPYLLVGEMAPEEGSEQYFSVFNFSTVIPQAVAAFLLAYLTKDFFGGDMVKTIFTGGIFMIIASLLSLMMYFRKK